MKPSRRYLSPEPMLRSPTFTTSMAARGMQVPSYAYANNNPLNYVDPDGERLRVNPWMARFFNDQVVRQLERAIELMETPDCRCALTTGSGYEKAPWDDRDIYVGVELGLQLTPLDGLSLPWADAIWIDPGVFDEGPESIAFTIAHESGHFRPPFWVISGSGRRGSSLRRLTAAFPLAWMTASATDFEQTPALRPPCGHGPRCLARAHSHFCRVVGSAARPR